MDLKIATTKVPEKQMLPIASVGSGKGCGLSRNIDALGPSSGRSDQLVRPHIVQLRRDIPADLVVTGIGVLPVTDLAATAGLALGTRPA